jgi:hypothetical protein
MMAALTKEFLNNVKNLIQVEADKLQYNENLFNILEGDLMTKLCESLKRQLSASASEIAIQRAAPINILNKIIGKLSRLYTDSPIRVTENAINQKLVDLYSSNGINSTWHDANEAFNAYKWTSIELYHDKDLGELKTRAVPSHMFVPFCLSRTDPLRVDGIIKFMGEIKYPTKEGFIIKRRFWIYTKDEFYSIDEDGKVIVDDIPTDDDDMITAINEYGVLPFEYISQSRYLLIPKIDTDTLQMTLLVPILLTDMNFGSMFLAMPILYGIDIEATNMKLSPNHFWDLTSKTSQDGSQVKPEVGVIRAEPDLRAMMESVVNQLSLWLDSRNIKPGTIGKLTAENFSSGISKIISEMDTVEHRKMQAVYFKTAEKSFWRKLGVMHNELVRAGLISENRLFIDPETMIVNVKYAEIPVIQSREDKIRELRAEKDAGFTSTKRAIRALNPDSEDGIEDKIVDEIKAEKTVVIDGSQASEDNNQNIEELQS